jgi:hypothetical protein
MGAILDFGADKIILAGDEGTACVQYCGAACDYLYSARVTRPTSCARIKADRE